MNIEFAKYHLSQTIQAHNGIVRSLSIINNELLSASGDKTGKIFEFKDGKYQQSTNLTFFDNFLYSSCARIGGGYAVGCDKQIYLIDQEGNPQKILEGHEGAVCSLMSITENILISGSWDATAIVWNIEDGSPLYQLKGHKHGVAVYGIDSDHFVTGSQDGILRLWEQNKQVKEVKAHDQIIREIQAIQNVGFITSSNDETIKLWSVDLNELLTFIGHNGFVFTVKQLNENHFISGSDDRSVIIWDSEAHLIQQIKLPGSVWTIAINNQSDIIVGTNDGKIRVFSQDHNRKAPQEEIDQLEQESQINEVKQEGGLSQQELDKLPSTSQLNLIKGKKEGEIRLFKNGRKPEAYMWSASSSGWTLIGDVLGGVKQKKVYPGDKYFDAGEYDHIFDIDTDKGNLQLPFNEGDSPMIAAEKFCAKEGFSKYYLPQIMNFIKQNTQSGQQRQQPAQAQSVPQQQQQNIEYKYIPFTQYQLYENKNLQGLTNKLLQNNQEAQQLAMNEKEIIYFSRGIEQLDQQGLQAQNIDQSVLQILTSKLLQWPNQLLLPVYDFFRLFTLHFSAEALFSGLDRGIPHIGEMYRLVNLEGQNQILIRLILQTLCNSFKQNNIGNSILYNIDTISEIIKSDNILKGDDKTSIVLSNLILNISIFIYLKPTINEKAPTILCESIIHYLNYKERDIECKAKIITAVGNLLRATQNVRQQCKNICKNFILNMKLNTENQATIECLNEVQQCIGQ